MSTATTPAAHVEASPEISLRLYAETRDLEATARHLGHSKLETTRIYAKWSDRQLRETIGRW